MVQYSPYNTVVSVEKRKTKPGPGAYKVGLTGYGWRQDFLAGELGVKKILPAGLRFLLTLRAHAEYNRQPASKTT